MHSLLASASLCDAVGEQHYVLQLEHLPHADAILAALSTGGFKFVQVAPAGLVQGQTFQFVERVTDVHARQSLGDPNLFQTSSLDGFVRTWDTRAGATPVESYSSQHGGPVGVLMNEKDWMIPWDTIGSHSPPANLAFSHSRIL